MTNTTTPAPLERMRRRALPMLIASCLALGAFAIGTVTPQPAEAASCRAMMDELRQLDRRSARSARYDQALRQQHAALKKVERAMRQNRCNSRGGNVCRQYAGAHRKMVANIRALQRKAGGGGGSARKAALHRELGRKCSARSASRREEKRVGFFEALRNMGRGERERETERRREVATARLAPTHVSRERASGSRETTRSSRVRGGNYRAVCVRLGDGYYWPAGGTVNRGEFRQMEAECVASCPGQDVKLYVHPLGSETDEMIAASTGAAYTALPAAHAYRTAYQQEHQCGRGVETKLIASPPIMPRALRLARRAEAAPVTVAGILPMPRPQFDANGALVAVAAVIAVEAEAPSPGPIRVVGPKFLSDRLAGSIAPDRGPTPVPSAPAEGA